MLLQKKIKTYAPIFINFLIILHTVEGQSILSV